jgi:hypothetical protein
MRIFSILRAAGSRARPIGNQAGTIPCGDKVALLAEPALLAHLLAEHGGWELIPSDLWRRGSYRSVIACNGARSNAPDYFLLVFLPGVSYLNNPLINKPLLHVSPTFILPSIFESQIAICSKACNNF